MSHFTTIQTQIRDIDCLRSACLEMGLWLLENTEARGFGNSRRHGAYVIQLKGPFDIAVNKNAEGKFELSTDWWKGHVEKEVGKGFGRLLQLYGAYKASREALRRGFMVMREYQKDGTIKLNIGRR